MPFMYIMATENSLFPISTNRFDNKDKKKKLKRVISQICAVLFY